MQAVHELRLGAPHIQAQLAELGLERGLPSVTAELAELTCQPTAVKHSPGRSAQHWLPRPPQHGAARPQGQRWLARPEQ